MSRRVSSAVARGPHSAAASACAPLPVASPLPRELPPIVSSAFSCESPPAFRALLVPLFVSFLVPSSQSVHPPAARNPYGSGLVARCFVWSVHPRSHRTSASLVERQVAVPTSVTSKSTEMRMRWTLVGKTIEFVGPGEARVFNECAQASPGLSISVVLVTQGCRHSPNFRSKRMLGQPCVCSRTLYLSQYKA